MSTRSGFPVSISLRMSKNHSKHSKLGHSQKKYTFLNRTRLPPLSFKIFVFRLLILGVIVFDRPLGRSPLRFWLFTPRKLVLVWFLVWFLFASLLWRRTLGKLWTELHMSWKENPFSLKNEYLFGRRGLQQLFIDIRLRMTTKIPLDSYLAMILRLRSKIEKLGQVGQ